MKVVQLTLIHFSQSLIMDHYAEGWLGYER